MKQLIVACAMLPLLVVLIMQLGHSQVNMSKYSRVERTLEMTEAAAKQEGCFSEDIKSDLIKSLSEIMKIPEKSISLESTDVNEIKYRSSSYEDSLMHYIVKFNYCGAMAGNKYFGISDEKNTNQIVIDRYVSSEKLKP